MLDEVRALLVLQDRDRKLLTLAKDLEKLPQDETRAKGKLAADQQAVATAKEALTQAALEVKKLELDVQTRRTSVARIKTQQFETRKNEEYQALAHEVTRYEREIDELETRELELMERIDGLKLALKTAEEALARTQKLVDEDLASIAQRRQRMLAEQQDLKTQREKLSGSVPSELLPLYQRLLNTKNGLALARLHDGKCEGCHMKVIASTVMAVHSADKVTRCEDCGRILYVEEA